MANGVPTSERLNYHHLRYFWAVARGGNLTRTAARLRVSQSALSAQIQQLEAQLGQQLFLRQGRGLTLTEAGHLVLAHAEAIFAAGGEMLATLREGRDRRQTLRVGAVATLSRNFQESFVRPLLAETGVSLSLQSASYDDLLGRLAAHALDVVLSNRPPPRPPKRSAPGGAAPPPTWLCRQLARQPVSLVGHGFPQPFRFPQGLKDVPLILPGSESALRSEFEAWCEQRGVTLRVLAEVDDMATMRLLTRDAEALALLPSVVVRDELMNGSLQEYAIVPGLFETFYAITVERQFPHPWLAALLSREEGELLSMKPASPAGRLAQAGHELRDTAGRGSRRRRSR